MASAQVLKKQEHLEAGKKKLEEFRRKRAAKKATSTNVTNEKQPSETDNVRITHSNGVDTSDALTEGRLEMSNDVPKIADKEYDIPRQNDFISSSDKNVTSSHSDRNNDINASVLPHSYSNNEEYRDDAASIHLEEYQSAQDKFQSRKDGYGTSVDIASVVGKNNLLGPKVSSSAEENHTSSYFTSDGLDKHPSNDIHRPEKDVSLVNSTTSSISTANFMPKNFVSSLGNSRHEDFKLTTSSYLESQRSSSNINDSAFGLKEKFSVFSGMGEKKFGSAFNHLESTNHSSSWTSDEKYSDYNSEALSSSNRGPPSPPASGRRSRPSFLDTIQISKGPSSSPTLFGTEKDDISSSKVYPVDGLGSSAPQRFTNTPVTSGDGVGLFNITENKHDFFSQKQNEDFAALEQHIEDLTQEKFSLQRALEASRALAESLASENSALTDNYNQQGTVVNQLKSDLGSLQEEIKAQLAELEAVKIEYSNTLLECNAADERAKLLASEVIALEEKALRLRSNELKLERELENTHAEMYSHRKKMSSIEKDRQDLQSTIDALQEEKKLLQSKLRKASSSGKSSDFNKTSTTKTDVSTSTEDLDTNATTESANLGSSGTVLLGDEGPSSQFSPENAHLNLEGLPVAFPSDQIRMIQNINTLIVELTLEKDQLMQALSAESSQSSKLLELNKELTRKLEAQTQRLELLMAQSMANGNNQLRHQDIRTVPESTTYADEGDEVVERVLGWIMKLFPGGPSRRRPSKHL
ncbi:protein BLISTER [Salvia miltiorrhiza]|uniref:protein BLISTER n=1 Tax=Salvia miltiorrhiza TaxID=226208 RepID=UPI0025ABA381|nr:protein BLISTER [Salvia miltiorrhiza]